MEICLLARILPHSFSIFITIYEIESIFAYTVMLYLQKKCIMTLRNSVMAKTSMKSVSYRL